MLKEKNKHETKLKVIYRYTNVRRTNLHNNLAWFSSKFIFLP